MQCYIGLEELKYTQNKIQQPPDYLQFNSSLFLKVRLKWGGMLPYKWWRHMDIQSMNVQYVYVNALELRAKHQ